MRWGSEVVPNRGTDRRERKFISLFPGARRGSYFSRHNRSFSEGVPMSFIRTIAFGCAVCAATVVVMSHRPAAAAVDDHMSHMSAGDLAAPSVAPTASQGIPG